MATALEQSLADLCEKHDLLSFGLNFHPAPHSFFSVSLQWAKYGEREGVLEHGGTSAAALGNAVAAMIAKRTLGVPIDLPDEALTVGEPA